MRIARLVPLSFFVLVPMMEFALPFAIRLFPNLLPSTFEEKHQKEEKRMKLLKVRLEMAQLLERTLYAPRLGPTAREPVDRAAMPLLMRRTRIAWAGLRRRARRARRRRS